MVTFTQPVDLRFQWLKQELFLISELCLDAMLGKAFSALRFYTIPAISLDHVGQVHKTTLDLSWGCRLARRRARGSGVGPLALEWKPKTTQPQPFSIYSRLFSIPVSCHLDNNEQAWDSLRPKELKNLVSRSQKNFSRQGWTSMPRAVVNKISLCTTEKLANCRHGTRQGTGKPRVSTLHCGQLGDLRRRFALCLRHNEYPEKKLRISNPKLNFSNHRTEQRWIGRAALSQNPLGLFWRQLC